MISDDTALYIWIEIRLKYCICCVGNAYKYARAILQGMQFMGVYCA